MIPDGIDPHKAPLCSHGDPITVIATTGPMGVWSAAMPPAPVLAPGFGMLFSAVRRRKRMQ